MKKVHKVILMAILFITSVSLHLQAQPATSIDIKGIFGTYRWINEVVLQPCEITGDSITSQDPITSVPGQLFRIINTAKKGYVIKIVNYDTARGANEEYVNIFNQIGYGDFKAGRNNKAPVQRYFLISGEMLLAAASKIEREKPSLVAGIISLPFKFRLQDGDFNGNFNIGAAGGWRFGHYTSKTAFSILGAASVSTINLDTATVSRNKLEILGTNTLSALTLSVGGMVELGKVQAGLFIGFDWLSRLNNQKFGWRYQGKPWFSFGIGYTIFGSEKKDADVKDVNTAPSK